MIRCALCGEELEPPYSQHWEGKRGWEVPGKGLHGNSGSSLQFREPTGELACGDCIAKLKAGVSDDQLEFE